MRFVPICVRAAGCAAGPRPIARAIGAAGATGSARALLHAGCVIVSLQHKSVGAGVS